MPERERLTFYVKTFGCQMNMDDSEEFARLLRGLGLADAADAETADLVHINTCSVRRKAEEKFLSYLGVLRARKRERGGPVIGVGGCTAELMDLRGEYPDIDYVIGAGRPSDYIEKIRRAVAEKIPETEIGAGGTPALPTNAHPTYAGPVSAFQTVIRGCSNYCTYCVVPYARGPESSIAPETIRDEVESKVAAGAREIVLLGQNVLAYGGDMSPKRNLLDAIAAVHDMPGLARIRFVTSHPKWVTEDFLRGLKSFPKVCEQFHVPFQSGDDEILKRMNRGYGSEYYVETVEMIRSYFPGCGVSADAIAGFPGETELQFGNTLRLVERVRPEQLYAFKYSARPGTRAAEFEDDVAPDVKKERLARLLDMQENISRETNERLKGTVCEVMVVEAVSPGRYRGRTRENRIADFTMGRDAAAGDVARVRITGATPHAVRGEAE